MVYNCGNLQAAAASIRVFWENWRALQSEPGKWQVTIYFDRFN